jgi:MFS family permease
MLPVLSRDVYHVGSTANGILISAAGLGAMAGGLGLSAFSADLTRRGRLTMTLIALQGALLAVMALFDSYAVGVITLAIIGALGSAAVALITTLVQEHVPQEYRGRVIGFFLLTFISFPSAGAFLMGIVGDATSIQWALGLFAIIVILGAVVMTMRNPVLHGTE